MKRFALTRRSLFFLFILLAVFCASARAGQSLWEFAGWTGGGCYPNVAYDPKTPGRVYLASDVAGAWRSDDDGEHWQFINSGLGHLNVTALVPTGAGVLFAATGKGLYRSDNAGDAWRVCGAPADTFPFSRPESYRPVVVSEDAKVVNVGTADGQLYRSEDGCQTWSQLGVTPFTSKKPIMVLSLDGGSLYAAGDEGVARWSEEARAWKLLAGTPTYVTDFKMTYNSKNEKGILASSQGRLFQYSEKTGSWDLQTTPPGVYRIELGGGDRLWVAFNQNWQGAVRLSPDGQTWTSDDGVMNADAASDPTRAWAAPHGRVNALVLSPHRPEQLFRTDWWGVWRSDDGGKSWNEKIAGAPNTVVSDLAVDESGTVYVASMDNGLLSSSDAGKTYHALFPVKEYRPEIQGHVWRVLAGPKGRILATSSPWSANFNQVIVSQDAGGSFERVLKGLPEHRPNRNTVWEFGYPRALAVFAGDSNLAYLGIDGDDGGGLYRSKDGGLTWAVSPTKPPCLKIYKALGVDPSNSEHIYWGGYHPKTGGVYQTQDGGQTWKLAYGGIREVLSLVVAPDGRVYAGGENGAIAFSADRGTTWMRLPNLPDGGSVTALCPLAGKEPGVVAGSMRWHGVAGGKLYKNTPNFKGWENLSEGLPEGTGISAVAYDSARQILYVARYGSSVYKRSL